MELVSVEVFTLCGAYIFTTHYKDEQVIGHNILCEMGMST